MAFRIIKDTFIQLYEKLFKYVLLNLILMTLLALPLYIFYLAANTLIIVLASIYYLLLAGPILLAALNYIKNTFDYTLDPKIKVFFYGIKENLYRGIPAFLFTAVIYLVLIFDIYFFFMRSDNILMFFLGILFLYLFICFTFMQIYFWGLLTLQEASSLKIIFKRSFLLAIDNVFSSLIISIFLLIFVVLCLTLPVLIPFFLFSIIGIILLKTSQYTLEKYSSDQKQDDQEAKLEEALKGEDEEN